MLAEIKNIDLPISFGTKVDTLCRHLLWLRDNDPGAKSIVFSQYNNFLGVLAAAFSRFKIGYSSVDAKNGIRQFKEDPAVCIKPTSPSFLTSIQFLFYLPFRGF